jgi:hypothetical protein
MIASHLPESSHERLVRQHRETPKQAGPSFQPKISVASSKIAEGRRIPGENANFETRLYSDRFRRDAEIQNRRKEAELSALRDCTFSPSLNLTRRQEPLSRDDVTERFQKWNIRRQQRIEDIMAKKAEEELKECTFQPKTTNPHRSVDDNELYGGDGKAWGFHEFVERQALARTAKQVDEERMAAVFADGSRWSRSQTVPKGPNLDHDRTPTKSTVQQQALRSAIDALRIAEQASRE